MTNTKKRGRPRSVQITTDWEALAKRLQDALESSFQDNKTLVKQKTEAVRMAHELEKQVVGLEAVVNLLEQKLDRAHYPV
jgi:ribosomal protein S17E